MEEGCSGEAGREREREREEEDEEGYMKRIRNVERETKK